MKEKVKIKYEGKDFTAEWIHSCAFGYSGIGQKLRIRDSSGKTIAKTDTISYRDYITSYDKPEMYKKVMNAFYYPIVEDKKADLFFDLDS